MNKIWKIKRLKGRFTDNQLIQMIIDGKLLNDDYIRTDDMKTWIKIEDSIYQFYLIREEA